MHRHRVRERGQEYGWVVCVSVDPRSPRIDRDNPGRARADGVRCHAAHGGVYFAEYCSCGAWRLVEVNGHYRAESPWMLSYRAVIGEGRR
jgi:hypothetical protein